MVVWPFVLAGVLWGLSRFFRKEESVDARGLLLVAAIGVWSHPLLDLLNVYGVRLLMPFSEHWFKADALFIIDPWVWGLLLGALVLGGLRRTPRPARYALGVFAGYAMVMTALGKVGRDIVTQQTGVSTRTMVAPVFANPLRRSVLRDLGNEYESGELFFGLPSKYVSSGRMSIGRDQPGVAEAIASGNARWFLRWARFPVFTSEPAGLAWRVMINDIRFGRIGGVSWAGTSVDVPRAPGSGP
jgi:inner membrane protein